MVVWENQEVISFAMLRRAQSGGRGESKDKLKPTDPKTYLRLTQCSQKEGDMPDQEQ